MSAQWGTHDLSRLAGRIQQLFLAGEKVQPWREANSRRVLGGLSDDMSFEMRWPVDFAAARLIATIASK